MAVQPTLAQALLNVAKLPVTQVASLVGVSRMAYYKWLRGGNITPEHQAKLQEMIEVYHMKGFVREAKPLNWGLPHSTYEQMRDGLYRLSPDIHPIMAAKPVEEDTSDAFWACGFLLG